MIAASIGGLYYNAEDKTGGSAKFTYTTSVGDSPVDKQEFEFVEKGSAYGVVVGLDVKPMTNMNVGIRYQWNSPLEMEREYTKNAKDTSFDALIKSVYPDKAVVTNTLPQLIALGVAYDISPKFSIQPNFTYYLNSAVTWETKNKDGDIVSKKVGYSDGFDAGIGADWECTLHAPLRMGAGFFYTKNGASYDKNADTSKTTYIEENGINEKASGLDSWTFNLGGRYTVTDALEATLSGYYTMYNNEEIASYLDITKTKTIELSKSNWSVALGVGYKINMGSANAEAAE